MLGIHSNFFFQLSTLSQGEFLQEVSSEYFIAGSEDIADFHVYQFLPET